MALCSICVSGKSGKNRGRLWGECGKNTYSWSLNRSFVLSFPLLEKIWIQLRPLERSTCIWAYSPSIFRSQLMRPYPMAMQ